MTVEVGDCVARGKEGGTDRFVARHERNRRAEINKSGFRNRRRSCLEKVPVVVVDSRIQNRDSDRGATKLRVWTLPRRVSTNQLHIPLPAPTHRRPAASPTPHPPT